MKYKTFFLTLMVTAAIILVSFKIFDDDVKKNKILQRELIRSLNQVHYLKINIDDDFSERVFEIYLQRLDYNKRFLIKEDINEFEKYKQLIDDNIDKDNFNFFEITAKRIEERMKETKTYYTEILDKPFNFDIDEDYEIDGEKRNFCDSKKGLKDRWRKSLKYQVLNKVSDKLQVQEDIKERKDTTVEIKTFEEIEAEARKAVLKTHDDWFHRLSKLNITDRRNTYFNAIASAYDPHTQYYPPKDKTNFDISMSGKLEGIGAQLSQPNAYIKVVKIIPGSPCWKQGELEAGDLILKVAQADGEPVDVVDMRLDDAIKMIRGKKGTEVRLTIKKKDASIVIIPIVRDIIELEETFAKSTVIKDEDSKIGYIYLPKFYADFQKADGRRCSKDIEKELIKFKNEKIDGLIIDLRNNGGGSLQDVIDMVGLFIETGPVVQVKSRYRQKRIFSDTDPSILYNGPLTVIINEFSASASEIFAAAIQDYGRGIIVGSKHSFGKGTVQRFIGIDDIVQGEDALYKPYGALKLTIQKFYRINGGATQLRGVKSDIVLPDPYSLIDLGEKDMDFPIIWDEISSANYKIYGKTPKMKKIKAESLNRILQDSNFLMINEYAQQMKEVKDNTVISLNLKKYRTEEKKRNEVSKKYKNAGKKESELNFSVLKADSAIVYSDSTKTAKYDTWLKSLKKDIYVDEVFKITDGIK